ncbi:hypothetical protein [Amycolatopsis aidingensis]|uniref:hypothetical protein n=1 Tax=Amycolatopsis aidingensis TaxID=2842453 RepID=UPI001C0D2AD0|nr:hypothetical protein [Amycolatopsis aidingensis]
MTGRDSGLPGEGPAPVDPGRYSLLAAVSCLAAAVAFLVAGLTGAADVTPMPAAPWQVVVPAAVLAAVLSVLRPAPHHARLLLAGEVLAGVLMLAGSLGRLPHNLLFAIVWSLMKITGATPAFEMVPQWGKFVVHLVTLGAGIALLLRIRHQLRTEPGLASLRERRGSRLAPERASGLLRRIAVVAAVAPLPYGVLKVAWALGWRGGFAEDDAFRDVQVQTPGFGDTGVLAGVAVVIAVLMAVPVAGRWVRRALVTIGAVGALMLVPAGAVGCYDLVLTALGFDRHELSSIALWAFVLVYPTLLLWGLALAAETWLYWVVTKRNPAVDGSGSDQAAARGTAKESDYLNRST